MLLWKQLTITIYIELLTLNDITIWSDVINIFIVHKPLSFIASMKRKSARLPPNNNFYKYDTIVGWTAVLYN